MVPDLPNAVTCNTVPHVMVIPNYKIFSLVLHNCKFATVRNSDVNFCVF